MKPASFIFDELAKEDKNILVQDKIKNKQSRSPRGRRPRPDEGTTLDAQILEMALNLFLERGFDQTTVDAIAKPLRMTKRTIYVRHANKVALFKAAVFQAIERWVMPMEQLEALPDDNLEEVLRLVAQMRMAHHLSPHGLKVRRILSEESSRFPELVGYAFDRTTLPLVEFIGKILTKHHERGNVTVERPKLAATIFLGMVLGGASYKIGAVGIVPITAEIADRMNYGLKLFLEGIRRKD